ncbi:MAG TPA: glycine cleavage system protein GcvH [Ignavibacteriaceae bacterium]|jgi:glycine cleavage system H protein|nr:glycine cleavage system protein GcvH [Ignavibacteriaceae bacterium]
MNIPANLKYTKDHEWILIEGNTGTIGITEYAQSELGDVVFIDIDPSLSEITIGENCGSIEAVKTVSEIYAPCSGKVIEINPKLKDTPEIVNQDPYGEGWMLKVEVSDLSQVDALLDADAYKQLIGQ